MASKLGALLPLALLVLAHGEGAAPTCHAGEGGDARGRACAAVDAAEPGHEHLHMLQQAAGQLHASRDRSAPAKASALEPASAQRLLGKTDSCRSVTQDRVVQPVMNDVVAAFSAIPNRAQGTNVVIHAGPKFPEGYNKGFMPYSEHFQGIARAQGSNVLYLAGSGMTTHTGHLFVTEVASRPADGKLGPNAPDWVAPSTDVLVDLEAVDTTYDHCGGLSVWGQYLVMGCEPGCDAMARLFGQCKLESTVHFYDVSNPTAPQRLDYTVARSLGTAGASSLVQEADGRFLLLVGRVDSSILDFYRSEADCLASDPHFAHVGTWEKSGLTARDGVVPFFGQYQNLNLVRQADGQVFMLGTYTTVNGLGENYLDLFKLLVSDAGSVSVEMQGSKILKCEGCNFQAGAGVYIESPDKLFVYGVDWEPTRESDRKISVNEFASWVQ